MYIDCVGCVWCLLDSTLGLGCSLMGRCGIRPMSSLSDGTFKGACFIVVERGHQGECSPKMYCIVQLGAHEDVLVARIAFLPQYQTDLILLSSCTDCKVFCNMFTIKSRKYCG